MLLTLLERVAATRRGRAVILRGDAGIGKSSLIDALAAAARSRDALVHTVQVLDFGQAAYERPGPALAARLLGVATKTDEVSRNAAIAQALACGTLGPADVLLARDLTGLLPPEGAASPLSAMDAATRERGRARVLLRLVQAEAQRAPLVIVVEDIHWADSVEVAQLADLAAAVATLPVLIAVSTGADGSSAAAR